MTRPGSRQQRTSRARALLFRAAGIEKIIYASIGRAITRRPWKSADAQGFRYHSESMPLLIVVVVLSAVEIVIADLLVRQWLWLRVPLLVVGVWGLIWMTGLVCAHFMRPHTIGNEGIRVRNGLDLDALVRWGDVSSVASRTRSHKPKTPTVVDDGPGRSLVMAVSDRTNIDIVLERSASVTLPGLPPNGGEHTIDRLYVWADAPKDFLAAAREHLEPDVATRSAPQVLGSQNSKRRHRVSRHRDGPTIELNAITKRFGKVTALDGIDLTADAGSVLALLGPNGSGKTTTVRILATLANPDGGTARVCGYDTVRDAHQVRQLIGLTGQYASVDKDLTGYHNLVMIGRLLGVSRIQAKRRASELLADAGLDEAANKPVRSYSGGMRRRLDLAASIMSDADVVFLDEPTTGLDPVRRGETWALVRQLADRGSTVLLTTQYLEEADLLAHDIAIIDSGKVVARGTPDSLKRRTGSQTLDLRLRNPHDLERAARQVRDIVETAPRLDWQTGRLSAAVSGTDVTPAVVRSLDESAIEIGELSLRLPSLDDVFLTLTGHRATESDVNTKGAAT